MNLGRERPGFWVWFAWQAERIPTFLWCLVIGLELVAIYLQNAIGT